MAVAAERQIHWTKIEIGMLGGTLVLSALAAWAAVCAVRIAKDTSKKELRAYLALTPAGFRFHKLNGNFDAVINQQNSGQTPAFKVRLFSKVIVLTGMVPDDFSIPVPEFGESRNTVHPGHSYDVPVRAGEPFETKAIQGMLLIGERFYVIAVIEYYDIYNERRETRACWSLDVMPSDIESIEPGETRQVPFNYTAEHNDAT